MNKEHLETDLTIKASHKVGQLFTVDTPSNCPIICPPREIDQEAEVLTMLTLWVLGT